MIQGLVLEKTEEYSSLQDKVIDLEDEIDSLRDALKQKRYL